MNLEELNDLFVEKELLLIINQLYTCPIDFSRMEIGYEESKLCVNDTLTGLLDFDEHHFTARVIGYKKITKKRLIFHEYCIEFEHSSNLESEYDVDEVIIPCVFYLDFTFDFEEYFKTNDAKDIFVRIVHKYVFEEKNKLNNLAIGFANI